MTLTVIDGGPGPHVHALVIGIGAYPHLKGGSGAPMPSLHKFGNPAQLTSPPKSASAVAAALQSADLEWVVPLGSIDLLLASNPAAINSSGSVQPSVSEATFAAIHAAFEAWWERCDSDADNIALFYVAGHGIEGLHPIVLASDFGQSQGQPWMHAFDIANTREAFRGNRAQTQIFLVDACRQVTTANVEMPFPGAPPLRAPQMRQKNHCLYDLTVMATTRNNAAGGHEEEPSYFAAALIKGLAGGAAAKSDGTWWVTTAKLSERFQLLMEIAGGIEQRVETTGFTSPTRLARLNGTPAALLELSCNPHEATGHANLSWRQGPDPGTNRPARSIEPWLVPVQPGQCWVSATFDPQHGYLDRIDQDLVVDPPMTRERVVVR